MARRLFRLFGIPSVARVYPCQLTVLDVRVEREDGWALNLLMFYLSGVIFLVTLWDSALYYAVAATDGNGCRVKECGSLCNVGYVVGEPVSSDRAYGVTETGAWRSLVHVPLIENRKWLFDEACPSTGPNCDAAY